jgi:hypothetical protein
MLTYFAVLSCISLRQSLQVSSILQICRVHLFLNSSSAILYLRTYALYNRSKRILALLIFASLLVIGASAVGVSLLIISYPLLKLHLGIAQSERPPPAVCQHCRMRDHSYYREARSFSYHWPPCPSDSLILSAHLTSIPWIGLSCIDLLIFGLTLSRTWRANGRDGLGRIVRRDGALYFAAMALLNLLNIIAYWVSYPHVRVVDG